MSKAGIALAAELTLAAGIMLSTHAFADESEAAQIAEELGQDPGKAEETAASEPVKQLTSSSVQVTASRVERELLEVPMSVSVITSEDIRKSPASTVGGLLQDVPGVEVVNSGAQGLKRISIRGESPHRTLVLIDGQKIAENKSMDGTPIMIDPSIIERIEVIRGPASVLYGSEAMGGVVNIITKKGGTKPIQGEAGVSFFGDHTTWKSGTPEWRGRAGLRWAQDVNPELTVYADAFGRFSSPWEQENATGEISTRCNNWATANLSLGMDFGKEKEYSVGLEVLNITNERYYLSQGLQEAGTHVNARFSFRF